MTIPVLSVIAMEGAMTPLVLGAVAASLVVSYFEVTSILKNCYFGLPPFYSVYFHQILVGVNRLPVQRHPVVLLSAVFVFLNCSYSVLFLWTIRFVIGMIGVKRMAALGILPGVTVQITDVAMLAIIIGPLLGFCICLMSLWSKDKQDRYDRSRGSDRDDLFPDKLTTKLLIESIAKNRTRILSRLLRSFAFPLERMKKIFVRLCKTSIFAAQKRAVVDELVRSAKAKELKVNETDIMAKIDEIGLQSTVARMGFPLGTIEKRRAQRLVLSEPALLSIFRKDEKRCKTLRDKKSCKALCQKRKVKIDDKGENGGCKESNLDKYCPAWSEGTQIDCWVRDSSYTKGKEDVPVGVVCNSSIYATPAALTDKGMMCWNIKRVMSHKKLQSDNSKSSFCIWLDASRTFRSWFHMTQKRDR